ncbi:MAG: hypothetical protein V4561_07845 [Bacteroidota bacterium]
MCEALLNDKVVNHSGRDGSGYPAEAFAAQGLRRSNSGQPDPVLRQAQDDIEAE